MNFLKKGIVALGCISLSIVNGQTGYEIIGENYVFSQPSLSRTVDQSKPVFSIPSEVKAENGGAIYNVPIKVPQGVNGLQPSLSVKYNSNAGNGLLGYGWYLEGLSAIERSNKNFVFNGETSGPELDGTDAVALDGQQLVLESGSNLSAGAVYRTGLETFQQITFQSGGFVVQQKDGIKKYYGTSAASRVSVTTGGVAVPVIWLLEKVEDRHGQQMSYEYVITNSPNEYRLNKIRYVGFESTPRAEVEFHYSERRDSKLSYKYGEGFRNDILLSEIRTTINTQEYTDYHFNYLWRNGKTGNDFSRLVEIKYEEEEEEVNSTLVGWNEPTVEGTVMGANMPADFILGQHGNRIVMDANGDGKDDIITLEYERIDDGECWVFLNKMDIYNHEYKVYSNISNGSGFTRSVIVNDFHSQYKPDECMRNSFGRIYKGDFNGDNLMDFVLHRSFIDGAGTYYTNEYHVDFYLNNRNNPGTFTKSFSRRIANQLPLGYAGPTGRSPMLEPFQLLVADFDGDGITDISYTGSGPNFVTTVAGNQNYSIYWNILYINSDQTFQHEHITSGAGGTGRIDSAFVGDFNGDSKADILMLSPTGSKIMVGESRSNWKLIHSSGYPTSYHWTRVGDFNGDNITDVFTQVSSGTSAFEITYFNGKNFVWPSINPGFAYGLDITSYSGNKPSQALDGPPIPLIADIDKDGRDDICFFIKNGTDYELKIHYNKTTGWATTTANIPRGYVYATQRPKDFDLVDFNGSGHPQLFYFCKHTSSTSYQFSYIFRPSDKSELVGEVLDGYNRLTKFTYTNLVDQAFYSRDHKPYPNPTIGGPLTVVKNIQQYDFKSILYHNVSYRYHHLRYNKLGLGLLGYERIEEEDYIHGYKWETIRGLIQGGSGNTWPFGIFQKSKRLLSNGNLIRSSEYSYKTSVKQSIGSSVNFLPALDRLVLKDYILQTSQETNYQSYDGDGNELMVENSFFNNTTLTSPSVEHQVISKAYVSNGSWLDWRTETSTKVVTRGSEAATIVEEFEYNTLGDLLKHSYQPGGSAEVITDYDYWPSGNLSKRTIIGDGMTPRVTNYTWTSDERFLKTQINPMGWVTKTNTYWPVSGQLKSTEDQNGLLTEYEYDPFGRITRVDYPDGNYKTTSRHWDLASTFAESLYYVATDGSNEAPTETWYNGKLLKIRDKWKNRNGDWVFIQTIYNPKGQVSQESLPYLNGGQKQWVYNNYDDYGRIYNITSPTRSVATIFNGRTTTITNVTAGQTKSFTIDATGLKESSTDKGGSIFYTYNAYRKPTEVRFDHLTITIGYDDYGFQTKLTDPGAGVLQYEYDALGQLITQIDGKSNSFTMEYDVLGRMTKRTGPDGDYNYSYDTQFKGALDNASSPYQTSNEYGYDGLGRLHSMVEHIGGGNYEFFYHYNTSGNLEYIHYPNDLVLEYQYDSYGYITDILKQDDQQRIWSYVNVNEMSQITEYELGANTVTRKYSSNSLNPESYSISGVADMEYDFESSTANLLNRKDLLNGLHEEYKYDDLNRLLSQEIKSGGQYLQGGTSKIEAVYESNGSISSKTDAGEYTNQYGRTLEVTTNPATISATSQIIDYTPFNSVRTIQEGPYDAFFTYGYDDQRRRMRIEDKGNVFIDRYYLEGGRYERDFIDGKWRNIVYVQTPTGKEAAYINYEGNKDYKLVLFDLDYLGSINGLIDENGGSLEKYGYDAWGNRKDVSSGENTYLPGTGGKQWHGLLYRGFTGHEHLDCFGLINMNGRLYDPILGRMLSPDNFIQNLNSTQNLNRYVYVYNNPLKYQDPDGEWVWAIPVVVGAAINVVNNWDHIATSGDFGTGALRFLGYAALGGVNGYVSFAYGVGGAALGGAIENGGNALIRGSNLETATLEAITGAVTSGVSAGIGNGVSSSVSGALTGVGVNGVWNSITSEMVGSYVGSGLGNSANLLLKDSKMTVGSAAKESFLGKTAIYNLAGGAASGAANYYTPKTDLYYPYEEEYYGRVGNLNSEVTLDASMLNRPSVEILQSYQYHYDFNSTPTIGSPIIRDFELRNR